MKKTHKTKNITCRIVSKGIIMQVNTIDEILSPGQYKIDACGVTASDGFPDGVDGECLSAYLEVSDTNHSADNLKSAAVGQTLTYTDADGDTAVYHRSGTNKEGKVEWSSWSDTAALGLQDGSITSEKLSKDIRTKIDSPLRSLFIAAGAEYNDTGADKTKTAPWGESVTHKAGHYYLNGLGDITEEEMIKIYNSDKYWLSSECIGVMSGEKVRTNRAPCSGILYKYKEFSFHQAFNETNIEILFLTSYKSYDDTVHVNRLSYFGQGSKYLKRIVGVLDVSNINQNADTKINPPALTNISIINMRKNFSFYMSPNLSKDSVVYMITNASPTTAITITLHHDAYARLANDADIVTVLEAQPLVSLVSA